MQWHDITLLVLYCCLTVSLVVMKAFKIGRRRRGVVKTITSLCFLSVGIFGCIAHRGGLHIIALFGLVFACAGDIFLIFMDKRLYFLLGICSFGMASLLLSVFSVLYYGWQWWSVIPYAVLVLVMCTLQITKKLSYGQSVAYLNVYTLLVTACGCLGLSLFCQGTANLPMFLFGLGCFMYLCSDLCLAIYMFKCRNRVVDVINSLLYFPGMLLIAVSVLL